MSTIYQGLAPATYFNSLCRPWRGTGVVVHMLADDSDEISTLDVMLTSLNATVCKLHIGLPDPGLSAAANDDEEMQALWTNAGLDLQIEAIFESLVSNEFHTVILSVAAPMSWMSTVMSALTGSEMLSAYVRYICGCVAWFTAILPASATALIKYVEVYHEPDKDTAHVSPMDTAALSTMLHTALYSNYGTAIQVSGPALSQVVSVSAGGEPYTNSFHNRGNSIGLFTYHVEPNVADVNVASVLDGSASDGCCSRKTIAQRDLMCQSLEKSAAYQMSVVSSPMTLGNTAWAKERWATSWGKRPRIPVSAGRTDAECYGIAAARTLCAMLLNGVSCSCFHRLTSNATSGVSGIYAIPSTQGSSPVLEPWGGLLSRLGALLPIDGQLYVSEEMSSTDNTLKSLIVSKTSNSFTFILCRPEAADDLKGTLRLIIRNQIWSDAYQVSGLSLESFPARDLSAVQTMGKVRQGQVIVTLDTLPYESTVVLVRGQVLLNPPIIPPPVPVPSSFDDEGTRLHTIIQTPINYGEPAGSTPPTVPGTLYFDTESDLAKVYTGSAWINVTMLT